MDAATPMKFLVLIETSGNQNFIFSTNKLRENVGASYLTKKLFVEDFGEIEKSVNNGGTKLKELVRTSGKALYFAADAAIARELISKVTAHALRSYPGLRVGGVFVEIKGETADDLHHAIGEANREFNRHRDLIPGPEMRFRRLPFVAPCAASGLPASGLKKLEGDEERPYSSVSLTKSGAKEDGYEDIKRTLGDFKLLEPEDLDKLDWVAVIHADGNGVGQTFMSFLQLAELTGKSRSEYAEKFKKFSDGLDACTSAAFKGALENLKERVEENKKLPVVPLVLGGDDITVFCDGRYAVRFAEDFLKLFAEEVKENGSVNWIKDLGICAGVAIVKSKFPFHQAYRLAEELLQSAKWTKTISTTICSLDYHVVYDSAIAELDDIREKVPFVARPYVVVGDPAADPKHADWLGNHDIGELTKRIDAIHRKDEDGRRKLPNSQLHFLREILQSSHDPKKVRQELDRHVELMEHRYDALKTLTTQKGSFFFEEDQKDKTHFLDALEISEFWR